MMYNTDAWMDRYIYTCSLRQLLFFFALVLLDDVLRAHLTSTTHGSIPRRQTVLFKAYIGLYIYMLFVFFTFKNSPTPPSCLAQFQIVEKLKCTVAISFLLSRCSVCIESETLLHTAQQQMLISFPYSYIFIIPIYLIYNILFNFILFTALYITYSNILYIYVLAPLLYYYYYYYVRGSCRRQQCVKL